MNMKEAATKTALRSSAMTDWRIDLVEELRGQRLVRSKYYQPSAEGDHDHCAAYGATFSELDRPDFQHEGYTTGPEYSRGRESEWVCLQRFDDLKGEMEWSIGYSDHKPN
jgi:hypothetical protein